jgi:hypothetical protein
MGKKHFLLPLRTNLSLGMSRYHETSSLPPVSFPSWRFGKMPKCQVFSQAHVQPLATSKYLSKPGLQ